MSNKKKNTFANTLIEIGSLVNIGENASFDPKRLSSSTVKSIVSHINLLKFNNIPLDKTTLTSNVYNLLDKLTTRKHKTLKDTYKFQIGMTIKRLFPNVPIDLNRYNRNRAGESTRLSSPYFMENVRKIINSASKIINAAYSQISDIGVYMTALAVILSTSTSLRITELMQLKMSDIPLIQTRQSVNIKTKGSARPRTIMPNDIVLSVLRAIELQRTNVVNVLKLAQDDTHADSMVDRLNKNFILVCSVSHLRRRLKELAAPVVSLEQDSNYTLGFNIFRRVTTTLLVSQGAHEIAQSINNHSSLNTTLQHYNVQSTQAAEDAFNKLDRMSREMFTTPLVTADDIRQREQQQIVANNVVLRQPVTGNDIAMDYDDDDDDDDINDYNAPDTPPPSNAPHVKKI